uniref:Uncharacterized protein n=1 Tax=Eutreptiella gymnastica TaxID=73025 RepID=A0A7S4G7P6_9EUGL
MTADVVALLLPSAPLDISQFSEQRILFFLCVWQRSSAWQSVDGAVAVGATKCCGAFLSCPLIFCFAEAAKPVHACPPLRPELAPPSPGLLCGTSTGTTWDED